MKSDPRHAYKAVRYAVYKKLFGGNVNILDSQKAPSKAARARPRTLRPGQRGGNRKPQTVESKDIYEGSARGFILRFLNAGTTARYAGHGRIPKKPDDRDKWIIDYGGKGFRGAIAPRNWFGPRSQKELEAAAGNLQEIIDRVINNEFA